MMAETADGHAGAQCCPSVSCDQSRDNGFQSDSVQRIAGMSHGMWLVHGYRRPEWMQSTDCGGVLQVGFVRAAA